MGETILWGHKVWNISMNKISKYTNEISEI